MSLPIIITTALLKGLLLLLPLHQNTQALSKRLTEDELKDADFAAYLASSSGGSSSENDESEEEAVAKNDGQHSNDEEDKETEEVRQK